MPGPADIARRRDKFERDISTCEECVSATRAHVTMLEIQWREKSQDFARKLEAAAAECDDIRHRLNSIRVGILGLYDATEVETVDKKGNPR